MSGVLGQYTRHLLALLYRLFGSFSPAKDVNCYVFIHWRRFTDGYLFLKFCHSFD